jgi:hypothetical protein
MIFGLFTLLAEVEVLLNAALVSNSNDRADTTTIALDSVVNFIGVHRFVERI